MDSSSTLTNHVPKAAASAAGTSDRPGSSKAEAEAAAAVLEARVDDMVFRMMAKMEAGLPVDGGKRTRKVVRLSDEQARNLMAMPWPPAEHRACSDHLIDRLDNPKLRDMIRDVKASNAAEHKLRDRERARMRDQITLLGYAEMAIEVDEEGGEWLGEM